MKVYKFAVSKSPNCSNPITVVDNGNDASYIDFKDTPNLGSGNLADGTYPCVIIEFSDHVRVTSEAGGSCTTEPFTQDLCRTGNSSKLINGTTTNCSTSENRIAMYLTTASTALGEVDAFNPPECNTAGCTDHGPGFQLGASLNVSGTSSGIFTVNADGKICAGNNYDGNPNCTNETCELLPPVFTFTGN